MPRKKTDLLDLLLTFSDDELKDFGKYVRSPFFNTNEKYMELYSLLKKAIEDSAKQNKKAKKSVLDQKTLLNEVMKASSITTENYFRVAKKGLKALAEDFLIYQQSKEYGSLFQRNMLLESLQTRGLTDYFEKEAKAIKEKADKSEPFYYYSLFAWELLTYNFDSFQTPKIFNSSPEKMLEYINIHSDLERLQCWLSLLNHINLSLFAPKDISTLSEEELLKKKKNKQLVRRLKKYLRNLKKKATFQEPIIKVYHIALKFLLSWRMAKTEKAEKYFAKLRSYIFKEKSLSKRHLRPILLVANNFCGIRISRGEFEYAHYLWEQYKKMLDLELFFEDKYITPKEFKNIVTIGLMSGEIEETEKFIDEDIKKVPNKIRKYVENFNRANLHFHKKEYEKTETLLQKMTRRTAKIDVSYVLGLRVLELKLYCEWENHSDFDGEFQKRTTAFESLLKKGAISIRNTKHFLTFIENIGTVFEMKHYIMQKRKEKQEILNNLLKKIRNPKSYVIERKWLIESIEGLL